MYMLCEYSVTNKIPKSLQVVLAQSVLVCVYVCVCVCVCMYVCMYVCVMCVCTGVYNSCTCILCENNVRNKNQCHCKWYKPSLCECVCVCMYVCVMSVCMYVCVMCVCTGVYNSCTCILCENSVRNKNQCHCKWYKPSLCE